MARVLVIDDDKLFVKLMVHALQERNHSVDAAFDGKAGLRAFTASPFDVVVCDLLMPEQEGVETIRKLRAHAAGVAIVAISSGLKQSPGIDILHVAAQFGADVTLQKPFKLSELTAAVERVAAARQQTATTAAVGGQTVTATR
jgi:DNA-binding response OmpR family regulator